MKKKNLFIAVVLILTMLLTLPVNAAWYQAEGKWKWKIDGVEAVEGWITDGQDRYYIGSDGYMRSGWLELSGAWFFLDTRHEGFYGKSLSGWQWIDGYCYFFNQEGKMLQNVVTPDGYAVNELGVWMVDGVPQYMPNKGIITKQLADSVIRSSGASGGGSSGGGGSGGGSSGGGGTKPQKTYIYAIRYLAKDDSILKIVTGQGRRGDVITIEHLFFDDYEICPDQREEIELTSNNQVINIYYEKMIISTPSNAAQVSWEIHFVDEEDRSNEIFKSQSGKSEEGTELSIEFPERILKNGISYEALIESPYKVLLYGTGVQKNYIEFGKRSLPEEPDPDKPAQDRLQDWLDISRIADEELTGITSLDGQLITDNKKESDERLSNLFTMVNDTGRHEIYIIAKNHEPSAFYLNQNFPDAISVSSVILDTFFIADDEYTIMKVGFERKFDEMTCRHDFAIVNDVEAKCLTNGTEIVCCNKCDYEVSVIVPALGHEDSNHDDTCDICYESIKGNEVPEQAYFEIGDLQARTIGERVYLFRCIDEDYEDSLNNKQKVALFLCEEVIRSDIESTSEKHKTLVFGSNNNYKSSAVRTWLKKNTENSLFATHTSYTGIALAYTGATGKGTYEQLDKTNLVAKNKPFQLLEDNIFLLSVEEAVKYSDYLWKFNDSEENNPETQYSAYSKGYWLRTPQYQETSGQFTYGKGVYMVDLVDGNIHAIDVQNKTIGIRPAITVIQANGGNKNE